MEKHDEKIFKGNKENLIKTKGIEVIGLTLSSGQIDIAHSKGLKAYKKN